MNPLTEIADLKEVSRLCSSRRFGQLTLGNG
jgi:hypothetical protein